jgi:hypothetical protein
MLLNPNPLEALPFIRFFGFARSHFKHWMIWPARTLPSIAMAVAID